MIDRLMEKVVVAESGCWEWQGHVNNRGYGMISVPGGSPALVHRVSYEEDSGPIQAGLVIDHLCRNTRCVNPAHLEAVTQRENILRGTSPAAKQVAQTHCIHGHEFTEDNTYAIPTGGRMCRTCKRLRDLRYRATAAPKQRTAVARAA